MIILGTEVTFWENIKKSLSSYRVLWGVLIVTVLLDYFTTIMFMTHDGIHTEGNKIIRYLAYEFGIFFGVAIGKSLQLVAALCFSGLSISLARATLLLLLLINIVAIVKNVL